MGVVLLLSRARSGTGALASVLERHPAIVYEAEILDPTSENPFFDQIRRGLMQTPNDWCDQFQKYVQSLLESDRIHILDIKTHSLQSIAPAFHHFADIPFILQHLTGIPVPIINLRRNWLDQFISAKLAEQNRVWHLDADASDAPSINTVRVDIGELATYCRLVSRELRFLNDFFAGYKFSLRLEYRECFERDGSVTNEVLTKIGEFLNISFSNIDTAPSLKKQAPWRLMDKIDNIDDILEFLSSENALTL
jgi:Stf0 sulphotransferase